MPVGFRSIFWMGICFVELLVFVVHLYKQSGVGVEGRKMLCFCIQLS